MIHTYNPIYIIAGRVGAGVGVGRRTYPRPALPCPSAGRARAGHAGRAYFAIPPNSRVRFVFTSYLIEHLGHCINHIIPNHYYHAIIQMI